MRTASCIFTTVLIVATALAVLAIGCTDQQRDAADQIIGATTQAVQAPPIANAYPPVSNAISSIVVVLGMLAQNIIHALREQSTARAIAATGKSAVPAIPQPAAS